MRSEVFNIIVVLCILGMALPATAQHSLRGSIQLGDQDVPANNAEVLVLENGASDFTAKDGSYHIEDLPNGAYTVFFLLEGYQTAEQLITINGADAEIDFTLLPLNVQLSAVEVRAAQERLYAIKRLRGVEGTAIYQGKKTEVVLLDQLTVNTAANNARQIYGQISGLNIQENSDAGLQLNIGGRGLDPNRSASFNTRQNGYDISADVLGYPESYYSPPAEALREIQIVRGAASLQYGTQFGGLVNFIFKKPNAQRKLAVETRQSIGSFGLRTSFNSLSGTIGKLSYYTYYHYKQGEGFRPNEAFNSHNTYTHLGYQLGRRTRLTAEFTYLKYLAQQAGGITDAQFYRDPYVSNRTRNWFAVDWRLYATRLEHKFSSKTQASLQFFGLDAQRSAIGFRTNRVSQIDDLTAPRDLLINNFQNWGLEGRLLHRYTIGNQPAVWLIGSKYYHSTNDAFQGAGSAGTDADFRPATDQFPDFEALSSFVFPNRNLAVFSEHIFYLNPQLTLTPGVRYEFIRTRADGTFRAIDRDLAGNPIREEVFRDSFNFPRHILLAGLGLSYKNTPRQEWYLNVSQNYRSVTFNDIRVINPSDQVDPNISDERGLTADFGWRGRNDHLAFEIGAYGLLYDDRLGQVLRPRTRVTAEGVAIEVPGPLVRWRGNIGRAAIFGLEGLMDWNLTHSLQGEEASAVQLNYFVNLALTHSRYFASEIPGVQSKEVEFIPLVNLKTGLRLGYHNWRASAQYTYLSEQFTDATNAPQNRQDNISGIIGAIPAYGILDVSTAYQLKPWLQLEMSINNVLNSSYFTRRTTGYPGPGIIPSAPRGWTVSLVGQF